MIRPILLTHPQIPQPLHGLAPRTLLGKEWWNAQRQAAYAKTRHRCAACGVHYLQAAYVQRLEAHECYRIEYQRGRAELQEVVALCHRCHSFIHSERLWWMYQQRKVSAAKIFDVLHHGFELLRTRHLVPFHATVAIAMQLPNAQQLHIPEYMKIPPSRSVQAAEWAAWRLVINGVEYPSKFKDYAEWERYYLNTPEAIVHDT